MKSYEYLKKVDPYIYDEIFNWNVYQVNKEEILGANVLDVGAHFGFFTCLCDSLGAKLIVAIEANPNNYLKFIETTKDVTKKIAVHAAVWGKSDKIVTIDDESEKAAVGKGDILVNTITLKTAVDSLFPNSEDVFLKMDVEGSEYEALYNTSQKTFDRFSTIALEMHEFPDTGHKFTDLDKFIQSKGFRQTWYGVFYTDRPGQERETTKNIAIFKYKRI